MFSTVMKTVIVAFLLSITWSATAVDAASRRRGRKKGRSMISFTIYELQSEDGPRHSPLFNLPVGGTPGQFPQKMVLYNNDLFPTAESVAARYPEDVIGYDQVSPFSDLEF